MYVAVRVAITAFLSVFLLHKERRGLRSRTSSFRDRFLFGLLSSERELRGASRGGDEQNRTVDPLLARQVLSQLSYTPIFIGLPS